MSDENDEPIHRTCARIEREVAALPPRARYVLLIDLLRTHLPEE